MFKPLDSFSTMPVMLLLGIIVVGVIAMGWFMRFYFIQRNSNKAKAASSLLSVELSELSKKQLADISKILLRSGYAYGQRGNSVCQSLSKIYLDLSKQLLAGDFNISSSYLTAAIENLDYWEWEYGNDEGELKLFAFRKILSEGPLLEVYAPAMCIFLVCVTSVVVSYFMTGL